MSIHTVDEKPARQLEIMAPVMLFLGAPMAGIRAMLMAVQTEP